MFSFQSVKSGWGQSLRGGRSLGAVLAKDRIGLVSDVVACPGHVALLLHASSLLCVFDAVPTDRQLTELEDRAAKKAKVANSLAIFCRQAHQIGSGANNEYLQAIEAVAQLEAFAAVVYSSNFEFEMPDVEAAAQAPAIPETRPGTSGTAGTETPRYADVVREHGEAEGASISLPGTESYADVAKEAESVEKINVVDGEGKGETAEEMPAAETEVKKETETVEEKAERVAENVESGFESAWKKAEDGAKAGGDVV